MIKKLDKQLNRFLNYLSMPDNARKIERASIYFIIACAAIFAAMFTGLLIGLSNG